MKDYSLIQSTWKNQLVKHSADYASLAHVTISEENRYLLKVIGLPLIFNTMDRSFLPFTYFPEIQVANKGFYLLGDVGFGTTGTSLLGLDKEQENIYVIWIHGKDDIDYKFMNQSLYQYLMCLAYYTNFIKTEYPLPSNEVNKQVQADYQKLIDDMTKVDAKAMEDPNCFWLTK